MEFHKPFILLSYSYIITQYYGKKSVFPSLIYKLTLKSFFQVSVLPLSLNFLTNIVSSFYFSEKPHFLISLLSQCTGLTYALQFRDV